MTRFEMERHGWNWSESHLLISIRLYLAMLFIISKTPPLVLQIWKEIFGLECTLSTLCCLSLYPFAVSQSAELEQSRRQRATRRACVRWLCVRRQRARSAAASHSAQVRAAQKGRAKAHHSTCAICALWVPLHVPSHTVYDALKFPKCGQKL